MCFHPSEKDRGPAGFHGKRGWHSHSTATMTCRWRKLCPPISASSTLTGQEVNIVDPGVLYQDCNSLKILFQHSRIRFWRMGEYT